MQGFYQGAHKRTSDEMGSIYEMAIMPRVDWLGPVLHLLDGGSINRHGYDYGRPPLREGIGLSLFVV